MFLFFFSLFPSCSSSSRKKREKKSLYAYSFVVVHVVATVYNTLRRDRSNDNHTQVSLYRRGAKTAEKRRRRRKKKEEEVVRKNTRLLIQKDSNRDLIKRRVATSREVDRHEYDATNLHSEPPSFSFLPCDAFWFGLRDVFRACFFMTF